MSIQSLKEKIRAVPDFPKKGILFWDLTTLMQDPDALRELSDRIYEMYKDKGITKVVGLEARGFMLGGMLAYRLGAGFVPQRKPGKLPYKTVSASYTKEYGEDSLHIHEDAITSDDVVLIHDDLMATGGTVSAAVELVSKFKPKAIYVNHIVELAELGGASRLPEGIPCDSLIIM